MGKTVTTALLVYVVGTFGCTRITTEIQKEPRSMSEVAPSAPVLIDKPAQASITLGLVAEHQDQVPLLDSFDFYRNEVRATRIYRDGARYLLLVDRQSFEQRGPPKWERQVTLTPKGVSLIEAIIRDQLITYAQPSLDHLPAAGGGETVWVAYTDNEEHTRQTGTGTSNSQPRWVGELGEAVMQNVVRRSPR